MSGSCNITKDTPPLPKQYKGARFYINVYTAPTPTDFTGKTVKVYFDNITTGARTVVNEGVGTDLTVTGVYHSNDETNLNIVMSKTDTANLSADTDYLILVIIDDQDVLTSYILPVVLAPGDIL